MELIEARDVADSDGLEVRPRTHLFTAVRCVIVALFGFTVWRYSWMSDDAFLTVRSALNWVHGAGPQFNPEERVINYTHPLWFLVIALAGLLTGSWVYSVLYLSIALACVSAIVLLWRARTMWQLVLVGAGLLLSNSIIEYSTSGLEGPLAMLFVACLFWLQSKQGIWPWLEGLAFAALLLCRLDYAVLVAPVMLLVAWRRLADSKAFVQSAVAFAAPLAIWAAVSYAYYGAVLPATLAAKTNVLISQSEFVGRGVQYVGVSFAFDPVLIAVFIGLGLLVALYGDALTRAWALGCVVYLVYMIWVGGDYMMGRFLALPALVILFCVTRLPGQLTDLSSYRTGARASHSSVSALLVGLVGVGIVGLGLIRGDAVRPERPMYKHPTGNHVDERAYWIAYGRGLDPFGQIETTDVWAPTSLEDVEAQSEQWDRWDGAVADWKVLCGFGAKFGMAGGPALHVVDNCGLSDVFVGQIPFDPATGLWPGTRWRAGHLSRVLPKGYVEALKARDPYLVEDAQLADRLAKIWDQVRPKRTTWVQ